MLVKILSFCATVLGTARYKAIFLSCFILVASLSGITAVALMRGNIGSNGASATVKDEDSSSAAPDNDLSPHLGGTKQNTKEPTQQTEEQPESTAPDANAAKPDEDAKPTAPAVEVALSISDFPMTETATSPVVTATISDNSKVSWSVVADRNSNGIVLVTPNDSSSQAGFNFQIKTDKAAKGKYTFTVTAKDAARNLEISKQITVTVTQ
jgi:hypothetical protein